jgi:hypothetical protein
VLSDNRDAIIMRPTIPIDKIPRGFFNSLNAHIDRAPAREAGRVLSNCTAWRSGRMSSWASPHSPSS